MFLVCIFQHVQRHETSQSTKQTFGVAVGTAGRLRWPDLRESRTAFSWETTCAVFTWGWRMVHVLEKQTFLKGDLGDWILDLWYNWHVNSQNNFETQNWSGAPCYCRWPKRIWMHTILAARAWGSSFSIGVRDPISGRLSDAVVDRLLSSDLPGPELTLEVGPWHLWDDHGTVGFQTSWDLMLQQFAPADQSSGQTTHAGAMEEGNIRLIPWFHHGLIRCQDTPIQGGATTEAEAFSSEVWRTSPEVRFQKKSKTTIFIPNIFISIRLCLKQAVSDCISVMEGNVKQNKHAFESVLCAVRIQVLPFHGCLELQRDSFGKFAGTVTFNVQDGPWNLFDSSQNFATSCYICSKHCLLGTARSTMTISLWSPTDMPWRLMNTGHLAAFFNSTNSEFFDIFQLPKGRAPGS